jgi:hypothetical protein
MLEDLHIAGVVVVTNHTLERRMAHTLAFGSASAGYILLTVPVLGVRNWYVVLVLERAVDDGLFAIPRAGSFLAWKIGMLNSTSGSRGRDFIEESSALKSLVARERITQIVAGERVSETNYGPNMMQS